MRVPAQLGLALLSLSSSPLEGQDLQYRLVTKMVMPAMHTEIPSPAMTVSLKGAAMRMDTELPGAALSMTMIIDPTAKKMYVLHHGAKTYSEQPYVPPIAMPDSATLAKLKELAPKIRETGEQKEIHGRETNRVVMSMEVPNPIPGMSSVEPGMKLVLVSEHWVSYDPQLVAAYKNFASMMSRGEADPFALALTTQVRPGFPVTMRMLMVQVPVNTTYDEEAILRAGDQAERLSMGMTMEMHDVKVGNLDAALFTLPGDYTKR